MEYSEYGNLRIKTQTAGGALPVGEVYVRISGTDENNRGYELSVITDRSGGYEILSLPAPQKSLSLSPNSPMQAYSTYDVEAYKDGYYATTIRDAVIFSGITSLLVLDMIPDGGFERNVVAPRASLNAQVIENEDLS